MDRLSLYHGDNLKITDNLIVKHPKLIDIKELGYEKYNQYVTTLILRPIEIADILYYDSQQWYEDISQWMLFLQFFMSNESIAKDALLWFTGIDFEQKLYEVDNQIIIRSKNSSIALNECLFMVISDYIRQLHASSNDFVNKLNHSGNKMAKKWIIKDYYKKREKQTENKIDLVSIVSSVDCKCCHGDEIWNYPIFKIYEMYHRLEQIDNWDKTMTGLYSGNIDGKKIDIENLNWSNIIVN